MKIRSAIVMTMIASLSTNALAGRDDHHEEVRHEEIRHEEIRHDREVRRDENGAIVAGAAAGLLVGAIAISAANANSAPDTEVVGDNSSGTRLEAESQAYLDGVSYQQQNDASFKPVVGPELTKAAQQQGIAAQQSEDMDNLALSIAQPQ